MRSRWAAEEGRWLEGDGATLKLRHQLYRIDQAGVVCRCCGLAGPAYSYVGHPCAGPRPALRLIEGGKAG